MPIPGRKESPRFIRLALLACVIVAGLLIVDRVWALSTAWDSIDRVSLGPTPTTPVAEPTLPRSETDPPTTSSSLHPESTYSPSPTVTTTETTSSASTTTTQPSDGPVETSPPPPEILALIGTDSRSGLETTANFGDFPGERADVITLAIRKGPELTLLSVPRDLYTRDTCNGGHQRISSAYAGCDEEPGLSHLVAELELVTGQDIQHAVAVDLDGFQKIVDSVGGYEICSEYPLRDRKSGLRLEEGCTVADGGTTLAWLRSRYTERLVNGDWEYVPGVSDLTRNQRQRRFLISMLHRQAERAGPGDVLGLIESLAPHLTIDDELTLPDAASWIWDLRNAVVETREIPVTSETTSTGEAVLLPTVDIEELVDELT